MKWLRSALFASQSSKASPVSPSPLNATTTRPPLDSIAALSELKDWKSAEVTALDRIDRLCDEGDFDDHSDVHVEVVNRLPHASDPPRRSHLERRGLDYIVTGILLGLAAAGAALWEWWRATH